MDNRLVFIAHEFDARISVPLREHVGRVLTEMGYTPVYAENDPGSLILEKVKECIAHADFAIFDLSSTRGCLNCNVILELGIAVGWHKPAYIAVLSNDFPRFQDYLTNLRGICVVTYETYADLADKIRERILPKHDLVPPEIHHFWQPFVEQGGVIVFGVQNIRLKNREIRAVTGWLDGVAFSLLYRFLASMTKPFLLHGRHLDTAFLPMPVHTDDDAKMGIYREHMEKRLLKLDRNLIILGTPNINPAAELVMAQMTNSEPFQPSDAPSSRLGYVVNDFRRACCSTFFRDDRDRSMGIWRSFQDERARVEYHTSHQAGGFIVRTKYNNHDVLVFSGYNGIATYGGLQMAREDAEVVAKLNALSARGGGYSLALYRTAYETVAEVNEPYGATINEQELLLD